MLSFLSRLKKGQDKDRKDMNKFSAGGGGPLVIIVSVSVYYVCLCQFRLICRAGG